MGDTCAVQKDPVGELSHEVVKDSCPCSSQNLDVNDAEVTSSLSTDIMQSLDEKQILDCGIAQKHVAVGALDKAIKKPDKVLPCPRCSSMDTKFCYYNNYNINQPRHFCKSCQRYWTAGGTMRNVPVGAGRRKSKHTVSHQRQPMISSCGAPSAGGPVSDSACKEVLSGGVSSALPLKGNESGRFSKDANLCESLGNIVIPKEQKRKADAGSNDSVENSENAKCTSINASNCIEDNISEQASQMAPNISLPSSNGNMPVHPVQCYPGHPWAYPLNPGWNNFCAMATNGRCSFELVHGQENGRLNAFPWSTPPMMAAPAFCTPTVPLPLIPASFWGCIPGWPNGPWGMPWVGSPASVTTSASTGNSGGLGNNSPLGKHTRDLTAGTEDQREKSLWVPKTLRIDDPDEAAKSSIWATLGIKPGKNEQSANGGIFKGFQPRTGNGEMDMQSDAAQVLHANPAALCRSQTFQETS